MAERPVNDLLTLQTHHPVVSYNGIMPTRPEDIPSQQPGSPASRADYRVRKRGLKDSSRDTDLDGTTLEERWDMMWPLAVTAYAFKGEQDADAEGLPRRIARLIRGKR
jgi:hypothetical protein